MKLTKEQREAVEILRERSNHPVSGADVVSMALSMLCSATLPPGSEGRAVFLYERDIAAMQRVAAIHGARALMRQAGIEAELVEAADGTVHVVEPGDAPERPRAH